ncbi:MAG: dUTP diphosphatase [Xanthomonadaceae bacterium]|nr:dUTP diphosphatase [Xanthomonadaceae bacterium]
MRVINVQKLHADSTLPTRAHADDAGMDLYALEDVVIPAGAGKMARTGVAIALDLGYVGLIADRSSLAKKGLKTAGGVIDAGYRGEIQVVFWNLSREEILIRKGDRMAQLLVMNVATPAVSESHDLGSTGRGAGGFGSTGR